MNKNRKIKRGVTAGIAAGMSFLLGALPVCAADTSVSKDETVYVNADATVEGKIGRTEILLPFPAVERLAFLIHTHSDSKRIQILH